MTQLCVLGALLLPGMAHGGATTLPSGTYYATIGDAITGIGTDDTIVIDPGVHVEDIVIPGDVVLEGAGVGVTTIQGAGGSNVVTVSGGDVEIRDLTIDGAYGARGVEVQSTAVGLTLTGVHLTNCAATGDGGAVSVSGGWFVCDSCTFTGNDATGSGGAIHATNTVIDLANSAFEANTASLDGGAIALDGVVSANLIDVVANNGDATGNGGFLHVTNPLTPVELLRVYACANTASQGGALYLDGDLNLTNSVIADSRGPNVAIHLSSAGTFTAINNHLIGNATGAFTTDGGTFLLRNLLVAWNGVGLTATGGTSLGADHNLFFGNGVDYSGMAGTYPTDVFDNDPLLYLWSDDGDCTNDLPTPLLTGPAIDAGDPTLSDPDGSRSDIGAYGGPLADPVLWGADTDGDGLSPIYDCDDTDPAVNQLADEVCDGGYDNNCDGRIDDETAIDATAWYEDLDTDGWGAATDLGTYACSAPPGTVDRSLDCDDTDPTIHPDAVDYCSDGVDSDCNGSDDIGAVDAVTWSQDTDGDGYGDPATAFRFCDAPGADWVQGDAFATDCDDTRSDVNPGMLDAACDGDDNNCSGDESDTPGWVVWWPDADNDGWGADDGPQTEGCDADRPASGTAVQPGDCHDQDATVYPTAPEVCDDLDNDCNGLADDGSPVLTWYEDHDGDGYGDESLQTVESFCPPQGMAERPGDCDDSEPSVHPGAPEVCDELDNDCNGLVDVDDPGITDARTGWRDADGDGWGGGEQLTTCDPDIVEWGGDCVDSDPTFHPEAPEVPGNELDENCDGNLDGHEPTARTGPASCVCDGTSGPVSPTWLLATLIFLVRRESTP